MRILLILLLLLLSAPAWISGCAGKNKPVSVRNTSAEEEEKYRCLMLIADGLLEEIHIHGTAQDYATPENPFPYATLEDVEKRGYAPGSRPGIPFHQDQITKYEEKKCDCSCCCSCCQ